MIKLLLVFLLPFCLLAQNDLEKVPNLFKGKQFVLAEQVLKEYLITSPKNLQAIECLGDAYGYQKQWNKAILHYKTLVDSLPNNANYHYKYGGALGMKALSVSKIKALSLIGDIKESFLKAASLDPEHIQVRWALVELYMQLPGIIGGSKTKSLMFANQLEALSLVDGYLAKGYIYEYDDAPKEAELYYKKAINVGNHLICYNKLTAFYEKQNAPNKAISNIEATQIKHKNKRNALHYQIGKVAAAYNLQLDKGEQCLKSYIENYTPADGVPKAWAYYRLSQIYTHNKNKPMALTYINLALQEIPRKKPFELQKEKILSLN